MAHKKKLIIICACLLTAVLLSVGVTLAYLGTARKKENKVTVGKGDVTVTESNWVSPQTQHMENSTEKSVAVTNTGTVPCFVRVYMEFSDSEVAGKATVKGADGNDYSWSDFKSALAGATNTVSSKWKYVDSDTDNNLNGYFYYTEAVAPDGITAELIKAVNTDYNGNNDTDSNTDRIRSYDIIVYSETVQTVDTDGTDYGTGNDWHTAWGRFLK